MSCLVILPANAQVDVTDEPTILPTDEVTAIPTEIATAEPPEIIIVQPVQPIPDSPLGITPNTLWTILAVGAFLFAAFRDRSGGPLVELLKRQDVRAEAQSKYLQSSIAIQDLVKLLKAGVVFGANMNLPGLDPVLDEGQDFLDDITNPADDENDPGGFVAQSRPGLY